MLFDKKIKTYYAIVFWSNGEVKYKAYFDNCLNAVMAFKTLVRKYRKSGRFDTMKILQVKEIESVDIFD